MYINLKALAFALFYEIQSTKKPRLKSGAEYLMINSICTSEIRASAHRPMYLS